MEYVKDLVTIVTPAYNAERFIEETIASVLKQTYRNWEMVIVDDCSRDHTASMVSAYTDERIHLIHLDQNKGAANAWNVAFQAARGQYLAFLDADDVWEAVKLEEQINFMKRHNYGFTYTAYDWIDENSCPMNKVIHVSKSKTFAQVMKHTNIGTLTVILDRKILGECYVKTIDKAWDYYLWGTILQKGNKAFGYDKVLAHYRVVSDSVSRSKKRHALAVWQLYYQDLKIPLVKCCYYFVCYALHSIQKYYLGYGKQS